jgi:hypothetical protein
MAVKGTGEPNSLLALYEPEHEEQFTAVTVNGSGKWTAKLKGPSAGSHEYMAEPVEAGSISSNAVKFTVP